ncbi:FKBP-like protein [Whalleya microplaca]|nr:FKBP-like protein [Whalleya microplaca]
MGAKKKNENKQTGKDAGGKGKGGKAKDETESTTKVKGGQSICVSHILCTKHSKKEEALALIEGNQTLQNFKEVAKTYSEDKARDGGYLGWWNKVGLQPEFAEVAFGLPDSGTKPGDKAIIGQAKTAFGYHIIVVHGRK